jgi:ABC-type multidrug transport system fused ATPase/permease subunit
MTHQVGSNGGGKSSTVSLLNRLFDPTNGEILIDDKPLKDYIISDIREAQAILCQDYKHFPFSIAENIAIGRPGPNAPDAVREAAHLADAQGLVEERGYEANVKPLHTLEAGWELWGTDLEQDYKEIEKPIELSGGQWQRLALARLFMRAASERVRLVVADEPSASLDPKVEYGT